MGNIIGYELNGQQVIRSVPSRTKRKPTALAMINRNRIIAVSQFLAPLKSVIGFGYKHLAPAGSRVGAFQTAQSHLYKEAIEYTADNMPYINPEAVKVFHGDLQPPRYLQAERNDQGIQLTWSTDHLMLPDAVLLVLAYNPDERVALFDKGGAKASAGNYDWKLDEKTLTYISNLHIYAGFYNISLDLLSDSVYAGCV